MTNQNKKTNFNNKTPQHKAPFNFYWIYAIIGGIMITLFLFNGDANVPTISFKEFKTLIDSNEIDKVVIVNEKFAKIYLTEEATKQPAFKDRIKSPMLGSKNTGPHFGFEVGSWKETMDKDLKKWGIDFEYKTEESWGKDILGWLLPFGILIALWIFFMRRMGGGGGGPGGQIFNIGKSKAKLFDKDGGTNITFNDVAGLAEAKEEVQEIVDFLKSPKKYTDLGAKIPKGALLIGSPGTGKTLLAKAVAGEAKVPFFSLSGSDFVEMFVGVGASRVRDLFKQAKEKAPAIIFIDEIDAIGRARGKNPNMGSNDERENTLNQLLTEMDGFGTNSGVIILAATNRADVLDHALMRPGRFDRQIFVDMPDLVERKQIFEVHLKPIKIDTTVDIDFLARQTPGFSGADIANICNEAALICARKRDKVVGKQHFLDAVDRIIGGLEKKNKLVTKDERESIAYHESGHATISWLLEHASPLVKVTIVPRGRSLGAAWYLPDERQITRTEQILDEICAALGGRASEQLIFGKISTGALSDLEKITKQAYAMVTMFGLNDKIGHVSYYDSSGNNEYSFTKPYSEYTAQIIDVEVKKIIDSQYQRALELLRAHKDKLTLLAKKLLEKEVIFKEDLEKIFGKRTYKDKSDEPISVLNGNTKKDNPVDKNEKKGIR